MIRTTIIDNDDIVCVNLYPLQDIDNRACIVISRNDHTDTFCLHDLTR